MKHAYSISCECNRCAKERRRRVKQSEADRTIPEVMLDWTHSRNRKRRCVASKYWDAFQSGVPMEGDDR